MSRKLSLRHAPDSLACHHLRARVPRLPEQKLSCVADLSHRAESDRFKTEVATEAAHLKKKATANSQRRVRLTSENI